jgi:hypothetical protein
LAGGHKAIEPIAPIDEVDGVFKLPDEVQRSRGVLGASRHPRLTPSLAPAKSVDKLLSPLYND